MLELLTSAEAQGLQNVYTPLSLKAHFVFCAVATVLYLTLFYRRGSWHYLAVMAAVDATFATQTSLCTTSRSIAVLGIIEIVLLSLALVLYLQFRKNQPAEQKEAAKKQAEQADEDNERRQLAEKIQKAKDKKFVDSAFDDGDGDGE
jgi:thiol:disulfide interchange protein